MSVFCSKSSHTLAFLNKIRDFYVFIIHKFSEKISQLVGFVIIFSSEIKYLKNIIYLV